MSDCWYDLYKHKALSLYIVGTPTQRLAHLKRLYCQLITDLLLCFSYYSGAGYEL